MGKENKIASFKLFESRIYEDRIKEDGKKLVKEEKAKKIKKGHEDDGEKADISNYKAPGNVVQIPDGDTGFDTVSKGYNRMIWTWNDYAKGKPYKASRGYDDQLKESDCHENYAYNPNEDLFKIETSEGEEYVSIDQDKFKEFFGKQLGLQVDKSDMVLDDINQGETVQYELTFPVLDETYGENVQHGIWETIEKNFEDIPYVDDVHVSAKDRTVKITFEHGLPVEFK